MIAGRVVGRGGGRGDQLDHEHAGELVGVLVVESNGGARPDARDQTHATTPSWRCRALCQEHADESWLR